MRSHIPERERPGAQRKEVAALSRASITKAHQKIQELSWEPTFVEPVDKYPTDYTFEKAPKKDPLKQVLRSYFPMEEEKDNRVFGAMDGAIRGNMFRQVQERWMEWQKLFLSIQRSWTCRNMLPRIAPSMAPKTRLSFSSSIGK